ncbi:cation transporter [Stutzerimonas stutzeri]|uniref:heavy-metal-associated domain-containing protein n=1 Tax=Stutzerimonas sp. S1 TaxID=3030652 RepID=UPI0022241D5A|nr:cation transporter [Stutzerimonas sp. S1]MCW3149683.1 cation transporter [Stutzerimonas sp. S1]
MQVFNVTGMTCGHCERAVIQAIHALDPAATVRVDLASGAVQVDSSLDAAAIRQAIEAEGYTVH